MEVRGKEKDKAVYIKSGGQEKERDRESEKAREAEATGKAHIKFCDCSLQAHCSGSLVVA